MGSNRVIGALVLTLAVVAGPAAAMTVEEVIAKHVEARGGDAWDEIETIRLTGDYTAFSLTDEATLQKKRGGKYHLASSHASGQRVQAFDGQETAWESRGRGPSAIEGIDKSILMRSVDFATPFFDYEERGFDFELLGNVDFEGVDAIGIELTRDDDTKETWYLDPSTYLEIGLVSPGNDWLGEIERRTYFDDFREVDGLMVPFYVESQWYTRNRVFVVASVETNVEIDDEIFRMPMPTGMDELRTLIGTWDVELMTRQSEEQEWQPGNRVSTIEKQMNGGLLQESWKSGRGADVLRSFSYDTFNEMYRVTQIDSRRNQMDVQEGTLGEDGRLVISNVESGTSMSFPGTTIHSRATFFDITEDGFKIEYESSTDGGETWTLTGKATYTPHTETASNG